MISNRVQKVCEVNEFSIYAYSPTIYKLFWGNMEPCSFRKRVRFSLEYLAGYKVYYLLKGNEKVGYCVVSTGGTGRYKDFSTKRDVIIGPYFISTKWRGQHLSELMLQETINHIKNRCDCAYDYIDKNNIISQKASERVGFTYVCDIKVTPILRSLRKTTDGEYVLLRIDCAKE